MAEIRDKDLAQGRFIYYPVEPSCIEWFFTQRSGRKICRHPVQGRKAHVSFVYLGSPLNVQQELNDQGIDINAIDVLDQYLKLESELSQLPQDYILTKGVEWGVFGRDSLAVRLDKDPEWMKLRRPLIKKVEEFIASFGVNDVSGFIKQSLAFKFLKTKDYVPHLTIGTGVKNNIGGYLSNFNLDLWEIVLKPPILKRFHG